MVRVTALVMVLAMTGCGLTQTRRPNPHRAPDQRPDCTESLDAPKRDAVGVATGFLTFLVGLLFYKVDDDAGLGAPLMIGGGAVVVGSYASLGIGYFRVKACRKAIKDFERRYPPPAHPPGVAPRP